MDGKGGMPSLRETLKGHIRANHQIQVVIPEFDLFSDDLIPLKVKTEKTYTVHIAKCPWLPPLKRFRKKILKSSKSKTVPYPLRWIINFTMFFLLTFSMVFMGLKVRKKEDFEPDLIYAHNQYAALAGFFLGMLWRIPNVNRLYGTFLADLMKTPFVVLRYPTATAGYIVPSTLLICGNDGTRGDEVAKRFKIPSHRFRFWQNGIAPPATKSGKTRKELTSFYGSGLRYESQWAVSCSRLSGWKRIDRMLHALKICRDQNVDCQLLIAGDGPEKNSLKNLAEILGISTEVIWLGAVDHDDIWTLMNIADVFMITNDVTNRCNPLYEAAWAGCPIVSVIDPSTSDLLKHRINALLAEKDDNETLGNYLAELLGNEEMKKRFQNEQKKLVSTFWTWEERMQVEVMELEKIVFTHKK
jgi:glycosyltransferase involved in cell wall biosynthesis